MHPWKLLASLALTTAVAQDLNATKSFDYAQHCNGSDFSK